MARKHEFARPVWDDPFVAPREGETRQAYVWRMVAYADETHDLALELFEYVFPPWRWPRWKRLAREVRRRRGVLAAMHMTFESSWWSR